MQGQSRHPKGPVQLGDGLGYQRGACLEPGEQRGHWQGGQRQCRHGRGVSNLPAALFAGGLRSKTIKGWHRVTVCLAAAAVVTHHRVILFPIGPKAPTLCPQWLSQALLHLLALLVPPSSRARLRSRLATKAPNKCMEQPKICSLFLFRVPAASRPAVQLVFGLPGAPPAPERALSSQQHLAGGTAAARAGLHAGWVLLLQSRISRLFFTSEWSASDF